MQCVDQLSIFRPLTSVLTATLPVLLRFKIIESDLEFLLLTGHLGIIQKSSHWQLWKTCDRWYVPVGMDISLWWIRPFADFSTVNDATTLKGRFQLMIAIFSPWSLWDITVTKPSLIVLLVDFRQNRHEKIFELSEVYKIFRMCFHCQDMHLKTWPYRIVALELLEEAPRPIKEIWCHCPLDYSSSLFSIFLLCFR